MKKLLREYDTGWMTGPSLGMTPDSAGLRGSDANQKNFKSHSTGLEWPYDNADEMHYGQPVGPQGIDRGTPMGSNVTGRPPTPKQDTWEGGPDEEMDEAMGTPFNSDMGGRGGAGKASPRGWAGSPLEFFVNGEQGDNEVPGEDDPAEFPPTNQFSMKLKEDEDEEKEEKPEGEPKNDEPAEETEEQPADEDVSDPGPFGFESDDESDDEGFEDKPEAEYDDSTDSFPGEENGPAHEDKPVDINGMGIELGQMFGEEGAEGGESKGEETGEEPPEQKGPMNPYPPPAESPPGAQLHGAIDQSDEELDSLIGGGFEDGPDMAIGLDVVGAEEGPGGSVSNPIDLFTRPSPWDNIELVLRGSKNGQGPTPPGKSGQPVAEGNWKKWLGAAGAAAGLAMGNPAFGADHDYPEPTFQKKDVDLPDQGGLPDIYRGENDPYKLGIDIPNPDTAGREVNFDNVDDEDLFASAKKSQK